MIETSSRRSDSGAQNGKKPNQKLKPYLVLQYLLKYSDEENPQTAKDIAAFLIETCGIYAERRSIYRDIEDINKAILVMEQGVTIDEAEEILWDDEDNEEKTILYKPNKGFYVRQRHFSPEDIHLLTECVYAAKFIDEKKAKKLVDVACEFVSEHQADKIKHNAFVSDRVKTANTKVYYNVLTINEAMKTSLDGHPHVPEKISFNYLRYSIEDMEQKPSRKGNKYIVSPYQLIINDGNYYLLCFDDKYQNLRVYRVDRMQNLSLTGIPRAGEDEFRSIDVANYTRRVFSMYGGTPEHVTIRFINTLLDTVIDRFGIRGAIYSKIDDKHFTVTVPVEVSDQFFGWLCGFGKRAKILSPETVVDRFEKHLAGMHELYE